MSTKKNLFGLYNNANEPNKIKVKEVTKKIKKIVKDILDSQDFQDILNEGASEIVELYKEHVGVGDTDTDELIAVYLGKEVTQLFYEGIH